MPEMLEQIRKENVPKIEGLVSAAELMTRLLIDLEQKLT